MKREAVGHTKMKRLCRRLDIPLWQGVGLLESIWHLTARETPRGDIGKLSDEDIALAIDYRGDESKLIEALVSSGWIDREPAERLIIHDWHEHADDAVHNRIARARQHFVGGHTPKLTRLPAKERDIIAEFFGPCVQNTDSCARQAPDTPTASARQAHGERSTNVPPEPLPEPLPEPEPHTPEPAVRVMPRAADLDSNDPPSERFEEAWALWPLKVEKDAGAQAWISLVTKSQEAAVFACIGRFLASDQAARNVVGKFGNWLFQAHRDGWAGDWPQTKEQQRQQQIDREWGGARAGRWSNA